MSPTAPRRSRCSRRSARRRPQFAHEALLVAAEGKLSKRLGSYGAEHLREEGVEPMALLSRARADRHVAAGRADRQPGRAGGELRLRDLRPRAGAFRPARGRAGQRPAAAQARLSRRSRTGCRRRRREEDWLLLRPEPRAAGRLRRLVRGAARRDRAARASHDERLLCTRREHRLRRGSTGPRSRGGRSRPS